MDGKVAARGRIDLIHALAVDEFHARYTVDPTALDEVFEACFVFLSEADNQLAGAFEGHVQFPGDLIELRVALDRALRLEGTGLVQEARVQHAGVPPAGLGADIAFLFQDSDRKTPARQLARYRAADRSAADDDHIVILHGTVSFSIVPAQLIASQ